MIFGQKPGAWDLAASRELLRLFGVCTIYDESFFFFFLIAKVL